LINDAGSEVIIVIRLQAELITKPVILLNEYIDVFPYASAASYDTSSPFFCLVAGFLLI